MPTVTHSDINVGITGTLECAYNNFERGQEEVDIDCSVLDCSISTANTLEMLVIIYDVYKNLLNHFTFISCVCKSVLFEWKLTQSMLIIYKLLEHRWSSL